MRKVFCGIISAFVILFSICLLGCSNEQTLISGKFTYKNPSPYYSYDIENQTLYLNENNEGYIVSKTKGGNLSYSHFTYTIIETDKYLILKDVENETSTVVEYQIVNENVIKVAGIRYVRE